MKTGRGWIPGRSNVARGSSATCLRRVILIGLCTPILWGLGVAHALGLGDAQIRSSLGRPLRILIPVIASRSDEIGCVQLLPRSDELPTPENLRSQIISTARGDLLEITTPQSVSDPAIGIRVSAGCVSVMTRDYVLFLDPPQTDNGLPANVSGANEASRTANDSRIAASAAVSTSLPASFVPRRARAINRPKRARSATTRAHAPVRANPKGLAPPVRATAPANSDRLVVSHDLSTPALRIAPELSEPSAGTTTALNAQQQQQLNDERARLAAYLTGTHPDAAATPRELEQQKKLDQLTASVALLQQQLQVLSAQNRKLDATRLPRFLTWLFAFIALVSLAFAAWVALRYRRAEQERRDHPWWEQTQLSPAVWSEAQHEHPTIAPHPQAAAEPQVGRAATPELVVPSQTAEYRTSPIGALRPRSAPDVASSFGARESVTPTPVRPPPLGARDRANDPIASDHGAAPTSHSGGEPLDFNLDMASSAGGATENQPDAQKTIFTPLAFDFSATEALPKLDANEMGPDTILRMDEVSLPQAGAGAPPHTAEQASVQFRLVQFAAVVDQAEELRRAGAADKAIAVLRQYVLRDETIPTQMWLLLFSLYKQVNKRAVYEALADHFGRRYRRSMVSWDESLDAMTPQLGLSSIPELDVRLKANSGTRAGIEMLRALTCERDQPDAIVFNGRLQHDLLKLAKVFPLDDSL